MNKKLTLWDTWEEMEDFQLPFGFFVALIFTLHTTWPDNSYLHLVSFQKMRVEKSWHFRWTRLTRIIISKKSCQHYHTINIDQLIDDDIQTRFFKRRIHQSNLPEKGPFKHDKENRVFVQSTIWRIFEWLLFLGNNIPQLFTKVSSLGAKLHLPLTFEALL